MKDEHYRYIHMKKFITIGSTLLTSLALAVPAFAQTTINPCPNDNGEGYGSLCTLTPEKTIPFIFTWIIIIAIVLALVFLVWGGIKWILSGGDKSKVEGARGTIIAAIVGLLIIFISWFVINLITQIFFQHSLSSNFTLPHL